MSVLSVAYQRKDLKMARFLLEQGASFSEEDSCSNSVGLLMICTLTN
jgi:hypothetical protein